MKPRIVSLTAVLSAAVLSIGCGGDSSSSPSGPEPSAESSNGDSLVILSTRVLGPMTADSTLEFEFVVHYRLVSRDSASREVGFNSASMPRVFSMDRRYDSVIHRGGGEFRIVASVPFEVYTAVSPFKGYVNLSPLPSPTTFYVPMASDWKILLESQ